MSVVDKVGGRNEISNIENSLSGRSSVESV